MSRFERDWQRLVAAARRAPPEEPPADLRMLAQRLAAQGLAVRAAAPPGRQAGWGGLAAAALLFAGCLVAATAIAPRPAAAVGDAFTLLASVPRLLPGTGFIPAPPRPPALSATFTGIAAWFSSPSPAAPLENAP
jgi:hypothetical protein